MEGDCGDLGIVCLSYPFIRVAGVIVPEMSQITRILPQEAQLDVRIQMIMLCF